MVLVETRIISVYLIIFMVTLGSIGYLANDEALFQNFVSTKQISITLKGGNYAIGNDNYINPIDISVGIIILIIIVMLFLLLMNKNEKTPKDKKISPRVEMLTSSLSSECLPPNKYMEPPLSIIDPHQPQKIWWYNKRQSQY